MEEVFLMALDSSSLNIVFIIEHKVCIFAFTSSTLLLILPVVILLFQLVAKKEAVMAKYGPAMMNCRYVSLNIHQT